MLTRIIARAEASSSSLLPSPQPHLHLHRHFSSSSSLPSVQSTASSAFASRNSICSIRRTIASSSSWCVNHSRKSSSRCIEIRERRERDILHSTIRKAASSGHDAYMSSLLSPAEVARSLELDPDEQEQKKQLLVAIGKEATADTDRQITDLIIEQRKCGRCGMTFEEVCRVDDTVEMGE
jgi:hypothetical protein